MQPVSRTNSVVAGKKISAGTVAKTLGPAMTLPDVIACVSRIRKNRPIHAVSAIPIFSCFCDSLVILIPLERFLEVVVLRTSDLQVPQKVDIRFKRVRI